MVTDPLSFSDIVGAVMAGNLLTIALVIGVRQMERGEKDVTQPFWFPLLLVGVPVVYLLAVVFTVLGPPQILGAIAAQ